MYEIVERRIQPKRRLRRFPNWTLVGQENISEITQTLTEIRKREYRMNQLV